MKHFFTVLITVPCTLPALAQNTFFIWGQVLNKVTGDTLPGATTQVTGNGQNTGSLDLLQAFFNRGRAFTVGLSATL